MPFGRSHANGQSRSSNKVVPEQRTERPSGGRRSCCVRFSRRFNSVGASPHPNENTSTCGRPRTARPTHLFDRHPQTTTHLDIWMTKKLVNIFACYVNLRAHSSRLPSRITVDPAVRSLAIACLVSHGAPLASHRSLPQFVEGVHHVPQDST